MWRKKAKSSWTPGPMTSGHVEDGGSAERAVATSQTDRMTALENTLVRVVNLVEGFSDRLQRQEAARDLSPVLSVHSSHCFAITGKWYNKPKTQCLRFKREGKEVDYVQRV